MTRQEKKFLFCVSLFWIGLFTAMDCTKDEVRKRIRQDPVNNVLETSQPEVKNGTQ